MSTLMHRGLDTDYRFGSIYVTNSTVEGKMRGKINVSFQINRNFFCQTSFSPEISVTSYDEKTTRVSIRRSLLCLSPPSRKLFDLE